MTPQPISRYGPSEIALRCRIDGVSLIVSRARYVAQPGTLAHTVVSKTYRAILETLAVMDSRRALAKRVHGRMTERANSDNENDAQLMCLWLDVVEPVARAVAASDAERQETGKGEVR